MSFTAFVWQLIALAFLRSAAFAFMGPASSALQEDILPRDIRGRFTGLLQSLFNAGAVTGPIIGFWLYDQHPQSPFYASALAGILSITVFAFFAREPKQEEAER